MGYHLTDGQKYTAKALVAGMSQRAIARSRGLAISTINRQVRSIRRIFRAANNAQLLGMLRGIDLDRCTRAAGIGSKWIYPLPDGRLRVIAPKSARGRYQVGIFDEWRAAIRARDRAILSGDKDWQARRVPDPNKCVYPAYGGKWVAIVPKTDTHPRLHLGTVDTRDLAVALRKAWIDEHYK